MPETRQLIESQIRDARRPPLVPTLCVPSYDHAIALTREPPRAAAPEDPAHEGDHLRRGPRLDPLQRFPECVRPMSVRKNR